MVSGIFTIYSYGICKCILSGFMPRHVECFFWLKPRLIKSKFWKTQGEETQNSTKNLNSSTKNSTFKQLINRKKMIFLPWNINSLKICGSRKKHYSGVLLKWEFFIKMRAACFAPSFLQKRGVMEWGWLQVGSSHFNEKFSL